MSFPEVNDTFKTIITGAGILLTVGGLWIGVNTKLAAMAVKVDGNTREVRDLQGENRDLKDLLIQIQLDQARGFGEVKLLLKDKEDKKD